MTSPPSPCIGVCAIDDPSGLCRGCGRTLAEIVAWGGLPEAERARTMALLPGRLAPPHGPRAGGSPSPLDGTTQDP